MKDHLNIFEYYNQAGALPIENNSTRNLGVVIKNNPLALYGFLDLVSERSKTQIMKPTHPDEWFLKLQVHIKNFAGEDIEIQNIIAMTLTTATLEFYGDESVSRDVDNITDMIIYSAGTLIVIEAKRNSIDATNQLKGQISELIEERNINNSPISCIPLYISLTWDDIVGFLNNINTLTNGNDLILNDYIEHIKNSVPAFFPVQTFNKLEEKDTAHVRRRLERFANNYGTEVIVRSKSNDPIYWVRLFDRGYIKELAFRNYNDRLSLCLIPGSTVGQGYSLYNEQNKLTILTMSSIRIQGYDLHVAIQPNLKISDAWGKWKFDVPIHTTDGNTLKDIFKEICGKRKSDENAELIRMFGSYKDIISANAFEQAFKEEFTNTSHNYSFIVSLIISINVCSIFGVLKKIDNSNSTIKGSDKVVEFTKELVAKVYELIEK